LIDWLIDWLKSRSRILLLWYGDVIITGEGLQNLGLCSALRAFGQGGDPYRATPTATSPLCRLLRHTRGYGGSNLNWILTGPHLGSKGFTSALLRQLQKFSCPEMTKLTCPWLVENICANSWLSNLCLVHTENLICIKLKLMHNKFEIRLHAEFNA
jgi:hypothetical protein